jgi:hypothetical protein
MLGRNLRAWSVGKTVGSKLNHSGVSVSPMAAIEMAIGRPLNRAGVNEKRRYRQGITQTFGRD